MRTGAVVFDCDGVLVDSEPLHARATIEYLSSVGIQASESSLDSVIGMRVRDQIQKLAEEHGRGQDADALYAGRERHFWSLVEAEVPVTKGAPETIRELDRMGIRLAVASSGTRAWITRVLEGIGLPDLFQVVVSGEDVQHPKPSPEPYALASRMLGLPAERITVVEDSVNGVASAVAAGCDVIVFDPNDTWAVSPLFSVPIVRDLREVPARWEREPSPANLRS